VAQAQGQEGVETPDVIHVRAEAHARLALRDREGSRRPRRGLLPDLAAVVVAVEGLVDPAGRGASGRRSRGLVAFRLPIEAQLVAEIDDLVAAEKRDQRQSERTHAENVSPAAREGSALRTETVLC